MGKTHRKNQPQLRSRTTRSSKPRLITSDPTESSALLTNQLRSLGLYAAPTLGDGNCLFRALSDQLYGSASYHQQLRSSVCDFIQANKARYEPFVEDERGLNVHLRCMRERGTYGGHMELSAFAGMVRRDVKVVQPGLVYVIEWGAGMEEGERERWKRVGEKEEKEKKEGEGVQMSVGTVYVAYHDWEHFSSIRNLKGPHTGLPNVLETPSITLEPTVLTPKEKAKERERERERERKEKERNRKVMKIKLKLPTAQPQSERSLSPLPDEMLDDDVDGIPADPATIVDPTMVPLPSSRSASKLSKSRMSSVVSPPSSFASTSSSSSSSSSSSLPVPNKSISTLLLNPSMRIHRSPKRSFDESASSEDGLSTIDSEDVDARGHGGRGRGRDKRKRVGSIGGSYVLEEVMDVDLEPREETPGLSAAGSSTSSSSSSSSESMSEDAGEVVSEDEVESVLDDDDETGLEGVVPSLSSSIITVTPAASTSASIATPTTIRALSHPQPQLLPPAVLTYTSDKPLTYTPSPSPRPSPAPVPVSAVSETVSAPVHKPNSKSTPTHASASTSASANTSSSYTYTPDKPLTRRQRKALGLPKPRAALVFGVDNNCPGAGAVHVVVSASGNPHAIPNVDGSADVDANGKSTAAGAGAGKIVIPGGKFKGRGGVKVREFRDHGVVIDAGDGDVDGALGLSLGLAMGGAGGTGGGGGGVEEWQRNGVGRVDVRGFRELKI